MMENFSKSCSDAADHEHCIIKEELIIEDSDEEIDVEKVDKEIYANPTNARISDSQDGIKFDKLNKSNETLTSRKSERIRSKNAGDDNKEETTQDLYVKSKNVESDDEESENTTNSINNEEPKSPVTTNHDIDELAKKVAEAYCKKCRKKSDIVRLKSRCSKCNTPFSYNCHTCDTTYISFASLSYHLKVKHIEVLLTYPCTICGRTFIDRKALMVHRRIQHQIYESLKCSKCGKEFRRSVNKIMHEKFCGRIDISKCEQTNLYKCDKCFYKTRQKKRMKSHTLEKHTEGFKAECKNCSKIFKTQRSLRRHVIHYCNKAKVHECDHCGHKFYRKDQIIRHIDQIHMKGYYSNSNTKERSPRTRICQLCGVNLAPHERIKDHRIRCKSTLESPSSSVTYKKEPRICKYCGETMKPREQMRCHVGRCESAPLALRYSAERVMLADIDAAYKGLTISYCVECKTKEPIKDQVRRCGKCGKRLRFTCVSCSKNYVNKKYLREHLQKKHVRNLNLYHCDKCSRSYNREKNFITHQRKDHSNKQPTDYKCKHCRKEYQSLASLKNHLISCGREPKYHCDKCPYKTYFKSSIIKHIWAKRGTCI